MEHLAGEVAFEATDDFAFGHSLCGATGDTYLGALITGETHHDDSPECVVGDAIAAAVEAMSVWTEQRQGGRQPLGLLRTSQDKGPGLQSKRVEVGAV